MRLLKTLVRGLPNAATQRYGQAVGDGDGGGGSRMDG